MSWPPELVAAARTELAQRSLIDFVQQAWPLVEPSTPFKMNWHLHVICEHLQAVSNGDIKNLCICIPPRHGKSLIVSVLWFCWMWIRDPGSKWLYASYAEELATRDAVKSRDIIYSDWYRARWGHKFVMKPDQDSKTRFVNNHGGHRISTSVGGRATGEGGTFLVTDDPHKISEVESPVLRQQVIDWWNTTIGTRGNDPKQTRRVIVMHRLNDQDLVASVLSQDIGYESLILPCRYEPDRIMYSFPQGDDPTSVRKRNPDVIIPTSLQMKRDDLRDPRKAAGELLWPNHFGEKEIRTLEMTLGPWGVAGQLEQRPRPVGGGIIKNSHFLYFRQEILHQDGVDIKIFRLTTRSGFVKSVLASACRWFQTVDTAMKDGQENDFTAVLTCIRCPDGEVLFYDVFRERITVPYQLGALMAQRQKYPQLMFQAVEDKQSGTGLIQTGIVRGIPFRVLKTGNSDKVQRAAPMATMYENGMIYHHAGQLWLADFELEMMKFPAGAHDDQVDTSAYACLLVTTDALLNSASEVQDFLVYPSVTDTEKILEQTGMSAERYQFIFGDIDDDTGFDDHWGGDSRWGRWQ